MKIESQDKLSYQAGESKIHLFTKRQLFKPRSYSKLYRLVGSRFDEPVRYSVMYKNSTYLYIQNFAFIEICDSTGEGEANMTNPKTVSSKKKRSSSKDFLEHYDLIWKNTAPVKYQNPDRWLGQTGGNSNANK